MLEFHKLDPNAILPIRATHGSVGYDLYSLEAIDIPANTIVSLRTGICCNFGGTIFGQIGIKKLKY